MYSGEAEAISSFQAYGVVTALFDQNVLIVCHLLVYSASRGLTFAMCPELSAGSKA